MRLTHRWCAAFVGEVEVFQLREAGPAFDEDVENSPPGMRGGQHGWKAAASGQDRSKGPPQEPIADHP